jgi:hypothetical protein
MALQFETTTRNAMLDAITTKVGANGRFKIWSGTVPANCAATPGGTILVDMPISGALGAASSGGVLTLNAIAQTNAAATGTATFFRIYDSASATCYVQGTVGTSGADLNLNTTSITSGGPDTISSMTFTAPGA